MQENAKLNDLLITLGRSLLQYVGEAWPWSSSVDADERQKIDEIVARQKVQIARLADFLADRNWMIDFGSYPTEYTDLHYVALDYLLRELIANQQAIVGQTVQTLLLCDEDPEAAVLLNELRSDQQAALQQLQSLAARRDNGATV
jgi:hypothetical protein